MRLAYLTRDEVNRDLARTFAAEQEIELQVHGHPEAIADPGFDAVLCDLDSFPADERGKALTTLMFGLKLKPIALHSSNVNDRQRHLLHANGVLTVRPSPPQKSHHARLQAI